MSDQNHAILEVKDLSVSFGENEVLSDISFSVADKDILAIIGPNGAGKSVLLRGILNLIPHKGEVDWRPGVKISYVPQKLSIESGFPMSVREFLLMKSNEDKLDDLLFMTGILNSDILDKSISSLSGGQMQRVLIAWAIASDPNIILFDEPLAGIDVGGEETIYNLLEKLNKEKGMSIVMISHDLSMVSKYATNVLCINKKMICIGQPEDVINHETTTRLYGHMVSHHNHNHHDK